MNKRALLLALGACVVRPASALYDPKPIALGEAARGTWSGTLTYRDYQKPDRMVTLPTAMTCSLSAPDELALYFVFDDGPGKTVYSYERMRFDLSANSLVWTAGTSKPSREAYSITSSSIEAGRIRVTFERPQDDHVDQYAFEVTPASWTLEKHEVSAGAQALLRHRYSLRKRDG